MIVKCLLFFSLIFLPALSKAQQPGKLYYLLDTAATPVNDRLWKYNYDAPIKCYEFKIPSFAPNDRLLFSYNQKATELIIRKAEIKKLHLLTLFELLKISKKMIEEMDRSFDIYFIEPHESRYKVHKVSLNRTRTVN